MREAPGETVREAPGETVREADVTRLSRARVFCVGDAILDRFVTGVVERVSREAPVPVLRVTGQTAMLGGAGNVARNLATLGAQVDFLSVSGDDAVSNEIADLLDREPGLTPHVFAEAGRRGTLKIRYTCKKQQMLRADWDSVMPVGSDLKKKLLDRCAKVIGTCGALVISDYGKGLLSPELLAGLVAQARRVGIPTIVDPSGTDYALYAGVDIIKPNQDELAAASGLPVDDDESVCVAAQHLIDNFGFRGVLVTRGARGATLMEAHDRQPVHLGASARDVFDVSGAGDTVVAVVAAGLAAGLSLDVSARLANIAAGLTVAKAGTAVVTPEELQTELTGRASADRRGDILDVSPLLERVSLWRTQGFSIGFANGCFDLLHPGHLGLLAQAKGACDRLVVAVNTDRSVAALKGPGRPVRDQSARTDLLAALSMVDVVTLFDEDTPCKLIEAIRPDVLVKGKDYVGSDIAGADIVREYGGRVLLADVTPGYSTTATLQGIVSQGDDPPARKGKPGTGQCS